MVTMRKTFYISASDLSYLKKLNTISVSEHIRRAITEYIKDIIKETSSNAAQSLSKKGGENGR